MSWASTQINQLKAGQTVSFRPQGNSMEGRISSGQLCTLEPVTDEMELKIGDAVLCEVSGWQYLHLIKVIKGNQYTIANNKGDVDGTIARNAIFGRCIKVEN